MIYLVVPYQAQLFSGDMYLKVLVKEAQQHNKKIFVVTKDTDAHKKMKELDISCGDSMPNTNKNEHFYGDKTEGESFDAVKNPSIPEARRKKDTDDAVSVASLIEEQKTPETLGVLERFKAACIGQPTESTDQTPDIFYVRVAKKNMRVVYSAVAFSILLLFFIVYVALPSAKVVLTPQVKELSFSTNIVLADRDKNRKELESLIPNYLPSDVIEVDIEKQISFPATGEIFEGQKARGEITLYNEHHKEKYIVSSRFATEEGLVFWTQAPVTIPPRTDEGPGEIIVPVEADDYDLHGKVIGSRGNIEEGKLFTMPAIPYLSPRFYYAKNNKEFWGGNIDVIKYVSQEDIQAAKQKLEASIRQDAQTQLKEYIAEQNIQDGTSFSLLSGDEFVEVEVLSWDIPEGLVDTKTESFVIGAQMKISGRVYDQEVFFGILEEGLMKKVHPDMYLKRIDRSTLVYNLLERDEKNETVKVESELRALTSYNLHPDSYVGQKIREKILDKIAGRSVTEAKALIRNMEEIFDVEIVSWPVWSHEIPTIRTNISIETDE
ncbi:MAG: hypothetical protein U9Q15_04390 [Patescibacteria group bacterium]|nr:hypothetical protein [Patescibacteria group bacterium]